MIVPGFQLSPQANKAVELPQDIELALQAIADRLDALEPEDLDYDQSDGILAIELENNGTKIILSRQSATQQIWLAEPERGWHFDFKDGAWIDDVRGRELLAWLSELLSRYGTEKVAL